MRARECGKQQTIHARMIKRYRKKDQNNIHATMKGQWQREVKKEEGKKKRVHGITSPVGCRVGCRVG